MLDLVLGSAFALTLYLGYRGGFLRGAISLVSVLAAVVLGYRLGGPGGHLVGSWTAAGPLFSRWIASAVVFLVILILGALVANRCGVRPSRLRHADRIAGAFLSGGCCVVTIVLILLVVGVTPNLPPPLGGLVAGSRIAGVVTAENGWIASVAGRILGDRLLESHVRIGRAGWQSRLVIEASDRIDIPGVTSRDLVERPVSARDLFERLNTARIGGGVGTLEWSRSLAEVAGGHGREMYEEGYFSHVSPATGTVDDRLRTAGVAYTAAGENLALSATVSDVHHGLMASPSHRAVMLDPRFTRVGVSALEGPFGLMVVQVFAA